MLQCPWNDLHIRHHVMHLPWVGCSQSPSPSQLTGGVGMTAHRFNVTVVVFGSRPTDQWAAVSRKLPGLELLMASVAAGKCGFLWAKPTFHGPSSQNFSWNHSTATNYSAVGFFYIPANQLEYFGATFSRIAACQDWFFARRSHFLGVEKCAVCKNTFGPYLDISLTATLLHAHARILAHNLLAFSTSKHGLPLPDFILIPFVFANNRHPINLSWFHLGFLAVGCTPYHSRFH